MPTLRLYGCNATDRIVHAEYVECLDLAAAWEVARSMLVGYHGVEMWDGDKRLFKIQRGVGEAGDVGDQPERSAGRPGKRPPAIDDR